MGRKRSDTSKSRTDAKKTESVELVSSTPKRYPKLQTSASLLANVSCDDFPYFLCSQPGDSQIDVKWDCKSPDTYRHIQLTKRSHLGETGENGIPDIMHTLGIDESDDAAGTPPGILLGLWTKVDDSKLVERIASQNKPNDDTSRGVRRKRPSRSHGLTSIKTVHDLVTRLEQAIDDHAGSSVSDLLPNDSVIDKSAADDGTSVEDLRQSFGAEMWSDDDLFADDSIVLKATQGFLEDSSVERRLDESVNMSGNSKRKHFVGKTSSPFMPYMKSSRHTSPVHMRGSSSLLPKQSLKVNLDDILKQSTLQNIPSSICTDDNTTIHATNAVVTNNNVISTMSTALKPHAAVTTVNSSDSILNTNIVTRSNPKHSIVNTCDSSAVCTKSDNVIRKHSSFDAVPLIPSATTCVGMAMRSNSRSVAETGQRAKGPSSTSIRASIDCGNSGATSAKWRRYNSDDIIQSKSVVSYGDKNSYGANTNLAGKSFSNSKISTKSLNQSLTVNRQNVIRPPVSTVNFVTKVATVNTTRSSYLSSTSKKNTTLNSPRRRSLSLSDDQFQFDASFTDDLLCQIVEEVEFLQSQITGVVSSPGVIPPTQTIVTNVASLAQNSNCMSALTKSIPSTRSSFSGSGARNVTSLSSSTRPCISSTITNGTMATNLRTMTTSSRQGPDAKHKSLSNNSIVHTIIPADNERSKFSIGTSTASTTAHLYAAVSTNTGILASTLCNSVMSSNSAIVSHCTSVPSLQRGKYTFKSPPHKPKLGPDKKLVQSNPLPAKGTQSSTLPVVQFPAPVRYSLESKSVHDILPAPLKAVSGRQSGPVKVSPGQSTSNNHAAGGNSANIVLPVANCDSFTMDDAEDDALCTQQILDLIDQVQSQNLRKPPPKSPQIPANVFKPSRSVPSLTRSSRTVNVSNKPPVTTCLLQGTKPAAASIVDTICSVGVTTSYSGRSSFKGSTCIRTVTSDNTVNIDRPTANTIKPNVIPNNNQVAMSVKPATVICKSNVVNKKPVFPSTSLKKSSISPPVGICKPLAQCNPVNTGVLATSVAVSEVNYTSSSDNGMIITPITTTVASTKSMSNAHDARATSSDIPLDVTKSRIEVTKNTPMASNSTSSSNSTLGEDSIPSSQSMCSQAIQCTPEEIQKKKHEALKKLKERQQRQRNKGVSLPRKGKP